jgi:hypothetical protein
MVDRFGHGFDYGEVAEEVNALDQNAGSVRDEGFPVMPGNIGFRRGDDFEVLDLFAFGIVVGADIEETAAVFQVIAVLLAAREKDLRLLAGIR